MLKEQVAELMQILKLSKKEAWDGFLASLEESHQSYIAARFRVTECIYEAYQQIKSAELETCQY